MRTQGSASEFEARRRRAVELRKKRWSSQEIAEALGCSSRSVERWWAAFREGGKRALAFKPHPGAAPRLSKAQKADLVKRLLAGARAQGFATDLWTSKRVLALIQRLYGVGYHRHYIPQLLRGLGLSWQKPQRRAAERDEQAIQQWVQRAWPRIKKKAKRKKAWIVFLDETGFLLSPVLRRTWARVGQTPLLRQRTRHHRRVSAIGGVSISPRRRHLGLYLQWYPDRSIRKEQVVNFLRWLRRHLRGPLIVLLDSLAAHKAKPVREYVARYSTIDLEYFPGYAPELNAIEYCWSWKKTNPLANYCPDNVDQLTERLSETYQELRSSQNHLCGFVRATGLPIRFKSQRATLTTC